MRRIGTTLLTTLVIALPPANAVAAIRSNAEAKATPKKTVITRTVVGDAGQADRWGTVQVTLTVRKTTTVNANGKKKVVRKATAVNATYQVHTGRSQLIMEQALPFLRQEALAAQSANIQYVSGATNTSQAFQQSLQSAILKALKV